MTAYTFNQLFDFTRTTSATFVGSNGLIQTTPASVNLLLYTQEFDNAAWTKTGMTVTANSTTAPDGTLTADTMTATAGTGVSVRVGQSGTTVNATVYTVSFYVRPGTHTFVQIHINAQAADWVNFTLTGSGSVQNNGAAVGAISFNSTTGYYRISATYTAGSTDRTPFFGLVPSGTATRNQTWNPTGTETIYIWGAQLEANTFSTTYTRNNGGVYPARFDYDPVTLAPKGILIEEQRTNLLTYSEDFTNVAWIKDGTTVTGNAVVSPSGATTADNIIENATNAIHRTNQAFTSVLSTAYTLTFYAKAVGSRRLYLNGIATIESGALFDLSGSGSVIATSGVAVNRAASIVAAGGGWYRCSITGTGTGLAGALFAQINRSTSVAATDDTYLGDGTSGLTLWGAQLEAGSFATSYIPTVASQVTRSADLCSIVAPLFAPWYNQSEGTFVAEYLATIDAAGTYRSQIKVLNAGGANYNQMRNANLAPTTAITNNQVVQGATQADLTSATLVGGAVVKTSLAYKANDFAAATNGATPVTDTSGTVPSDLIRLEFSGGAFSAGQTWLRRIKFYPFRASNNQLQALTV
jgi:hypothetical protein